MSRIGFEVSEWKNKSYKKYTNEELLEYWYKLRLTVKSGKVDTSDYSRKDLSTELYVVQLQNEIIKRMEE